MNTDIFTSLLPFIIGLILALSACAFSWQHRDHARGATTYAIQAGIIAFWIIGYIFETIAGSLQVKIFWDNIQWFGTLFAAVAMVVFAVEYTGKSKTQTESRRWWLRLSIVPLVFMVLVATNHFHHLVQHSEKLISGSPFDQLTYEFGPASYIVTLYLYFLGFSSLAILVNKAVRSRAFFQTQTFIIILGIALFLGLSTLFFVIGYDVSHIASAVSNAVVIFGIFRYRLFDLTPIAREVVIDNMRSAVMIFDRDLQIIDFNNQTATMLDTRNPRQIQASLLATKFPAWLEFIQSHRDAESDFNKTTVVVEDSHYELTLTAIRNNNREIQGFVLVGRDITEQVQARDQLQTQAIEIEQARYEFEILYRIARGVNNSANYIDILQAIVDTIGPQNYAISLNLFENFNLRDSTYLETIAAVPEGEKNARAVSRKIELSRETIQEISEHESLSYHDSHDGQKVPALYKALNVTSMAARLIQFQKRNMGVFSFTSTLDYEFTASELRLMNGIAEIVATAVEQVRLFQAEQQARIEAEVSRKVAEDANQIKSQFLANMSHELRTPLNAILNFTGFVAKGIVGPVNDEQVSMLNDAVDSGKHLLSLINDVLDITKIEAGLMDLFIQEVNMNEIMSATESVAKGLMKDKSINLLTEIDDLPTTYGDKRRLRQVMLNLISNAVKFTPEGSITIKASFEDNLTKIMVADTGIGMSGEDQTLVFESFKQAKHELPEAIGTGLGMPITKYFVEMHQGRIWLESELNKGTTFYVELPLLTENEAIKINDRLSVAVHA